MPTCTRTRVQDRRYRFAYERAINQARINGDEPPPFSSDQIAAVADMRQRNISCYKRGRGASHGFGVPRWRIAVN